MRFASAQGTAEELRRMPPSYPMTGRWYSDLGAERWDFPASVATGTVCVKVVLRRTRRVGEWRCSAQEKRAVLIVRHVLLRILSGQDRCLMIMLRTFTKHYHVKPSI